MSWTHSKLPFGHFTPRQTSGKVPLLAANLGDDADTTAAIYGQIAGAHYGAEAIPSKWRSKLAQVELITQIADHLFWQPRHSDKE